MARRLGELADLVGGRLAGDPDRIVLGLSSLELAGPADLSFLRDARSRELAAASKAAALLVAEGVELAGKDLVVVADPARAAAELVLLFHPPPRRESGVHPTAVVDPGATVHPAAHLGPYVVVGAGSRIEAGAVLLAGAVVGERCVVGQGATLHPHTVLYDDTEIGPGSILHAGAIVGADGFGYLSRRDGHHKVPQVGKVVIGADVEIGANAAIDRATFGETRIGDGTKIDNLVQVGHNVRMGRSCMLSGQAGIAGSARLGDFVVLGGQAGAAGHLTIGDGAQVAAKSAVFSSVPDKGQVGGIPAVELRQWRRQVAGLARLADLGRRLRALERRFPLDEVGEEEESS